MPQCRPLLSHDRKLPAIIAAASGSISLSNENKQHQHHHEQQQQQQLPLRFFCDLGPTSIFVAAAALGIRAPARSAPSTPGALT